MTINEISAVNALYACRFQAGSYDKGFVRDLASTNEPTERELSERQRNYLWKLVYRYRAQHEDKELLAISAEFYTPPNKAKI